MSADRIREIVELASNRLVNVAELCAFFELQPSEVMQILKAHA